MFDKLDSVAARFEELGMRLMEPNVTSDPARYTELMKEYRRLEPIVEKYREYKSAKEAFDEAKEMLDEGGLDPEMRALAQEQYDENREVIESASQELKILAAAARPERRQERHRGDPRRRGRRGGRPSSRGCSTACIRCTRSRAAGSARCSAPTRPSGRL